MHIAHCPGCTYTSDSDARFCTYCGSQLLIRDRYRLEERIGSGGFSQVYRAFDLDTQSACVVKRIDTAKQTLASITAEARIGAKILAPYRFAPRVFAAARAPGSPFVFLVMELVDGQPLSASRPWHPADVDAFLRQMLSHLTLLHHARVIHCDLKPGNILVTADGEYRIIDFGIAQIDGQRDARAAAAGSMDYCAPEQHADAQVYPCTDLYSLGVVAYELLTGALPPTAYNRLGYGTPAAPPDDAPDFPRLAPTIMALLELEPADRPQSAQDALDLLGPVPQRPAPPRLRQDTYRPSRGTPPQTPQRWPGAAERPSPRRWPIIAMIGTALIFAAIRVYLLFQTPQVEPPPPRQPTIAVTSQSVEVQPFAPATIGGIAAPDAPPTAAPVTGRIAFITRRPTDLLTGAAAGYGLARSTNSGIPEPVDVLTGTVTGPRYSPDGSLLVVSYGPPGAEDIAIVRPGNSLSVLAASSAASDIDPAWSPDGQAIVFSSNRDGDFELYVVALADGAARQLTDQPSAEHSPVWSPDGRIVFLSEQDGRTTLSWIAPADGKVTPIIDDANEKRDPDVAGDGRRIALAMRLGGSQTGWDIYLLDTATGERTQLTNAAADERWPAWSPDGRELLFARNVGGPSADAWQIYAIGDDGTSLRPALPGNYDDREPTWTRP